MKIDLELASKFLKTKIYLENKPEIRDASFKIQDKFVTDSARFIAVQCSRRAGKTNGLAIKFFRALEKHPKSLCLYIALTRESAKNIMWGILQDLNDKFRIGCLFTESNLTVTHPNGSRLQLFGADMKNFIRRLKGIKTPAVGIDEAQDFGSHLESLIEDVLSPTLTDYEDSWLAITGTPGPVPLGYFYESTQQRKNGFSFHSWTVLDNPYLPNAKQFIEEVREKRNWDEDNPTLLREWRNQWVLDRDSLVIKYESGVNHYEDLPKGNYVYILGVDLGFRDADALSLLAWSENSPNIYLVYEETIKGQDISALSSSIEKIIQNYNPSTIVMDTGGLGKKIAEEITRRKHIPIKPADKSRKMENIEFLNDWLRQGKFKAKKDSIFVSDSYRLQKDLDKTTPDRIVIKDTFHSDIIDAVLYAFKESPAFTYQSKDKEFKYGTKEWQEEESKRMEEAAEEFFKKQEEEMTNGSGIF